MKPVVSIIGIAVAVGFAYVAEKAYTNPAITAATSASEELAVGLVIAGFVIYITSDAYHRSRGMNLDMALKEIPPE